MNTTTTATTAMFYHDCLLQIILNPIHNIESTQRIAVLNYTRFVRATLVRLDGHMYSR